MLEVGVIQAKDSLDQLLDRVEAGEQVVITRRGKAIARLVATDVASDREHALRAAAAIRAMSKGVTLGDIKLKDLISEGRV